MSTYQNQYTDEDTADPEYETPDAFRRPKGELKISGYNMGTMWVQCVL